MMDFYDPESPTEDDFEDLYTTSSKQQYHEHDKQRLQQAQQQQFHQEPEHQWNVLDLASVPLPQRQPFPSNMTAFTHEIARETLEEHEESQNEKACKDEENTHLHKLEAEYLTKPVLAAEEMQASEHRLVKTDSLHSEEERVCSTQTHHMKGFEDDHEKGEPQTLAKKLLTKALGNVSKEENAEHGAAETPVSSSKDKVSFTMKPVRVQKVSFSLKSKKNMLKMTEEKQAEEEEGAKTAAVSSSTECAQPARFKRFMPELFRPDQDAQSEMLKQQQLLQKSQNALTQVLLQKQKTVEIESRPIFHGHQVIGLETPESGLKPKEGDSREKKGPERKRFGSRWSKEDKPEKNIDAEVKSMKVIREQADYANKESRDTISTYKLLNDIQSKTIADIEHSCQAGKTEYHSISEISDLYKNILDNEDGTHPEGPFQNILGKASVTDSTCLGVKESKVLGGSKDQSVEIQHIVRGEQEKVDRGNKSTERQNGNEGKTEKDRKGKATDKKFHKNSSEKSNSSRYSNSEEQNKKKETRGRSQSVEKEKIKSRDEERNRRRNRSRSRDRRVNRGEKRHSHERDYRRKSRSQSRDRTWRSRSSRSRSRDRYSRYDSRDRESRRRRRQSNSRERSRGQRHKDRSSSNEGRRKNRSRSSSIDREEKKSISDRSRDKEKGKRKIGDLKDVVENSEPVHIEKNDGDDEYVNEEGSDSRRAESTRRRDDRMPASDGESKHVNRSDKKKDRHVKQGDKDIGRYGQDCEKMEEGKSLEKHRSCSRDRGDNKDGEKGSSKGAKQLKEESNAAFSNRDLSKSESFTETSEFSRFGKQNNTPDRENWKQKNEDIKWVGDSDKDTKSRAYSTDWNKYSQTDSDSDDAVSWRKDRKSRSSQQRENENQEEKLQHCVENSVKDKIQNRKKEKHDKSIFSSKSMKGLKLKLKSRRSGKEQEEPAGNKDSLLPQSQETCKKVLVPFDFDMNMAEDRFLSYASYDTLPWSSECSRKPDTNEIDLGSALKEERICDVDSKSDHAEEPCNWSNDLKGGGARYVTSTAESAGENVLGEFTCNTNPEGKKISKISQSRWDASKTMSRTNVETSEFDDRQMASVQFSSGCEKSNIKIGRKQSDSEKFGNEVCNKKREHFEDIVSRKHSGISHSGSIGRVLFAETDEFRLTDPENKVFISEKDKEDQTVNEENSLAKITEISSDILLPNLSGENLALTKSHIEDKNEVYSSFGAVISIDSQCLKRDVLHNSSEKNFSSVTDLPQPMSSGKDAGFTSASSLDETTKEKSVDTDKQDLSQLSESYTNTKAEQIDTEGIHEHEKPMIVVSENMNETMSALKAESQTQMTHAASSPRTKSGRFGTASWSSGSKRRERGFLPSMEVTTAAKSKSVSSPGRKALSDVSKCSPVFSGSSAKVKHFVQSENIVFDGSEPVDIKHKRVISTQQKEKVEDAKDKNTVESYGESDLRADLRSADNEDGHGINRPESGRHRRHLKDRGRSDFESNNYSQLDEEKPRNRYGDDHKDDRFSEDDDEQDHAQPREKEKRREKGRDQRNIKRQRYDAHNRRKREHEREQHKWKRQKLDQSHEDEWRFQAKSESSDRYRSQERDTAFDLSPVCPGETSDRAGDRFFDKWRNERPDQIRYNNPVQLNQGNRAYITEREHSHGQLQFPDQHPGSFDEFRQFHDSDRGPSPCTIERIQQRFVDHAHKFPSQRSRYYNSGHWPEDSVERLQDVTSKQGEYTHNRSHSHKNDGESRTPGSYRDVSRKRWEDLPRTDRAISHRYSREQELYRSNSSSPERDQRLFTQDRKHSPDRDQEQLKSSQGFVKNRDGEHYKYGHSKSNYSLVESQDRHITDNTQKFEMEIPEHVHLKHASTNNSDCLKIVFEATDCVMISQKDIFHHDIGQDSNSTQHHGQSSSSQVSQLPARQTAGECIGEYANPQTGCQAPSSFHVDSNTMLLLQQQYEAMGYTPDQASTLVTQYMSSYPTQHQGVQVHQEHSPHAPMSAESARQIHIGTIPTHHQGNMAQGHTHQGVVHSQQFSGDHVQQHPYGIESYPQSHITSQQFQIPYESLVEMEAHLQAEMNPDPKEAALFGDLPATREPIRTKSEEHDVQGKDHVQREIREESEMTVTSIEPMIKQEQSAQTPTEDEPCFDFQTTSQTDFMENQDVMGSVNQISISQRQIAIVKTDKEDVVSSTNAAEAEHMVFKQEPPSSLKFQALDIKSGWQQNSEAEAVSSALPFTVSKHQLPEKTELVKQESETVIQEMQEKELSFAPPPSHRKKLKLAIGNRQLLKTVTDENCPLFEKITENSHLSQRRRPKRIKRIQCYCTTSRLDRAKKIPVCGEDCLNRMLRIECGSRCPCLDYCSNKRFQKKQYAKTGPFNCGSGKGWGLRACEDIPHVGTFVMEYVGELLGYKDLIRRIRQYAKQSLKDSYIMALNSEEVIDATLKGNTSRFLNHSCDPNCEIQKWTVNGELRAGLFSKKPVQAGEELTVDYQFDFYGESQKCYCGSETCNGFFGGQKTFPTKKRVDKSPEHRRAGLFEDELLDREVESISCLENGMKLKDHVLVLCQLMVRVQKMAHRLALLRIIENTTEINCLRLFLGYQGLPLLWSWMADIGMRDSEEDHNLKTKILSVLKKLPITNRTILKESKIMAMVEKWAAVQEPPALPLESDVDTDPLPLPLPVPPDRPVVSILTLHKDSKAAKSGKKRVTFADEAVNSDNDVVTSTNSEMGVDNSVHQSDTSFDTAGDDAVSTSEVTVPSSTCVSENREGGICGKDSSADSSAPVLDVKPDSDQQSAINSDTMDVEVTSLAEEMSHSQSVSMDDIHGKMTIEDTCSDQVPSMDTSVTSNIKSKESSSDGQEKEEADSTSLQKDVDNDGNAQSSVKHEQDTGRNPPLLSEAVDKNSQHGCELVDASAPELNTEKGDDDDMPTLVNEALCSGDTPEMDEVFVLASELLVEWSELKELYKIPRKQRIEERKKTERELEAARQGMNETDPYMKWMKNENPVKQEFEGAQQKDQEGSGHQLSKHMTHQLFEAQVKAEQEMRQQQEAYYHQQQAAAVALAMQHDPAYAALHGLHQDPSLLAANRQMSDAGLQHQPYGSMLTAEQQQALFGQDIALAAHHLMMQPAFLSQAQALHQQQVQAVYAGNGGLYQDAASLHQAQQQQLSIQNMAILQTSGLVHSTQTTNPVETASKEKVPDVPPPPCSDDPDNSLPEHWRRTKDALGRIYYYHTLTRATQWVMPTKESGAAHDTDVDVAVPQTEDPEEESRKTTTTAAADTSSEVAKKLKEQFRKQMSKYVVSCLNPYRRPDCKTGRIVSTVDFKHLARRLTHHILAKELKHCRNVEDLDVSENVKAKTRDYVKKYMSRCGAVFKKTSSPDDLE